MKEESSSVGG